jgi:hypothetical protein
VDDVIGSGEFVDGLHAVESADAETKEEMIFFAKPLTVLLRTGGSCASLAGHD